MKQFAPERIFATVNGQSTRLPDGARQWIGGWSQDNSRAGVTEYVRADLVERDQWQSIATAPKDGTDLLLSAENWHGDVVVGCWSFDGWRDRDCSDKLDPTHWMPVPVAVTSKSSGDQP